MSEVIESKAQNNGHKGMANLRMWQPGQSGNPGGRKRKDPAVVALLDQYGPEALKKIIALMDSADERVAFTAAKEVCDRAYGKPKPAEDGDGDDKRALTINIIRYTDGSQPSAQLEPAPVSVRTLALP